MKSLGLNEKLEKFKMTMLNFCSGIFEDYYDAYRDIMEQMKKDPSKLDANQIFILEFHNKISEKWSEDDFNWKGFSTKIWLAMCDFMTWGMHPLEL